MGELLQISFSKDCMQARLFNDLLFHELLDLDVLVQEVVRHLVTLLFVSHREP